LLDLACFCLSDAGFIRAAVGLGAYGRFIAGNARWGATAGFDGSGVLSSKKVRERREAPQWSFALSGVWTAAGRGIDPVVGRGGEISIRHACSPWV